jgi:predicted acyltransferase
MNLDFTRVRSIDAFRALTMFLMIFVNDIEDIPGVPVWIKHVGDNTDGLGLADTIFPAFLFIVGLSIPFAFHKRIQKGDSKIMYRIIWRALALIFIGFYHTNMETYDEVTAIQPKTVWESVVTVGFFFLFLDYSAITSNFKRHLLQGVGIMLILAMSVIYKSNDPNHWQWLHYSWWGILGLIGWAYLTCALIYYCTKGVLWVQAAFWILFMLLNIDIHFGWLSFLDNFYSFIWLAGNGSIQSFTMSGIFVAVLYMRLAQAQERRMLVIGLVLMAVILFNLGFIVRYFSGGISKARDTPSWVLICTGISLIAYAVFIFLVDFKKKYNWFKVIEPAGTNTFTCYLIPFIFYPLYQMSNIGYPEYLSQGTGGLIKCLVFSLAMIWIAGLLDKVNVRLKI